VQYLGSLGLCKSIDVAHASCGVDQFFVKGTVKVEVSTITTATTSAPARYFAYAFGVMVVGILIIFHVKREHGTFRKGGVIYAYHVLWKEGLGGHHAGSEV
jgi:hypothetical protein